MSQNLFNKNLSDESMIFFCRDLSSFLTSGYTLEKALNSISNNVSGNFSFTLKKIAQDVASGIPFSEALAKYDNMFSNIFVTTIKMAENSGNLDKQLMNISLQVLKEKKMKDGIKNVLVYPRIVFYLCISLILVNLILIIPTIKSFSSYELDFNNTSSYVFYISGLLMNHWEIYVIAIIMLLVFFELMLTIRRVNIFIMDVLFFFPGFRGVLKNTALSRFLYSLGLVINAGIPIISAVKIAGEVSGNDELSLISKKIVYVLERGFPLSEAFSNISYFNENFLSIISQAESTGNYSESFEKAATFYDEEALSKLKKLTTTLKPLISVFLALFLFIQIIMIIFPIAMNIFDIAF